MSDPGTSDDTAFDRLDAEIARSADEALAASDRLVAERYPDPPLAWQPVHTVYVPADRFEESTLTQWGSTAAALFDRVVRDDAAMSDLFGVDEADAAIVRERVRAKLATDPVEDLRVDFEDGYRVSDPEVEDADIRRVAQLWRSMGDRLPRRVGIRFRSMEADTRRRGLRTLGLLVDGLADGGAGHELLDRLVVTVPKVTSAEQIGALTAACERWEAEYSLAPGSLRFEIQVETPRSIMDTEGRSPLPAMIAAAAGRCVGLHYGTYDYSASLGVAAGFQALDHPVADHAKRTMQAAAAGTGIAVSDGSTNRVAVGDDDQVRESWRNHSRLTTRGLREGIYQGWDIHPTVLPSRFAATYGFFRHGLGDLVARLDAYLGGREGEHLDEPATARALAGFLCRGLDCGAVDDAEPALAVLDLDRLRLLASGGRP